MILCSLIDGLLYLGSIVGRLWKIPSPYNTEYDGSMTSTVNDHLVVNELSYLKRDNKQFASNPDKNNNLRSKDT